MRQDSKHAAHKKSKRVAHKELKHHSYDSTHVDCARLIGGTVSCLYVKRRIALNDAMLTSAYVKNGILCVDIKIELAGRSLLASGKIAGVWVAECRRCLDSIEGEINTPFHEVFQEHHKEEHHEYAQHKYTQYTAAHQDTDNQDTDIWPIRQNLINLAPPARECALLALPVAPLCSPDCVGPSPDFYPTYSEHDQLTGAHEASAHRKHLHVHKKQARKKTDSRWDALNLLHFND